jgi:hypothetical protein
MKKLEEMTRDEKSLLLFLETCAVDLNGRVDVKHMNDEDMEIAKRWNSEKFIQFGRICSEDINSQGSHWCKLTINAFMDAHRLRLDRAHQGFTNKRYKTTEEKRNE